MDTNEQRNPISLTLEPELTEAPALVPAQESAIAQTQPSEPVLTAEEQKIVDDFAAKIDVENTTQILRYGAGTQKKMADFSDAALANVRTQDLGPVGELLVNVEKIADALQQHQVRLMKDSAVLDKMYEQNLAYFKELTMYILAGKKKLEEVRTGKLQELQETAKLTGLAEDAQRARDLSEKCLRFEKKIHDLELTRTISIQTAPQIRMIQNNDTVMVEKIQTTLVNTIPLWKNQMVLALGIAHSTEAAQAQRQVADVTNAMLTQNAQKLHMASIETAKEAERGIVEIETLKKTNAELIATLDDVMKIQAEGRTKRQAAETEMAKMEDDLKRKLLQIRDGRQ